MASSSPQMAKRPSKQKTQLAKILAIAFVVLALIGAVFAFRIVRDLVKTWSATDLPGAPVIEHSDPGALPELPSAEDLTEPLQDAGDPVAEPWDGKSRITMLVMGLDARDWEAGETPRTDSMILATLDPLSGTAGMLSIPRDLWVDIPGFGYGKINQAYYFGELYNLPGGGPGLAMETVENVLGVPIDYYAQIDFNAFVRMIDEIDGVYLIVPYAMDIDPIGEKPPVHLDAGEVTLDGQLTLAYARSRYTDGGDFDRSARQQQVAIAIRDRILKFNFLPTLITKAPALYKEISEGIHTNLNLQQMLQLFTMAMQIDRDEIRQGVIGPDAVMFDKSPDGLDILIAIPDKIRVVRDEVFANGNTAGPLAVNAADNPNALLQQEQARVIIQNGTNEAGLASATADYFRSQGINVIEISSADRVYGSSMMVISGSKPYSADWIAKTMGIPVGSIYNRYDPSASMDITIVLGNDWATNNSLP
jgi:LCP family protein required for cell wall assembly